MFIGKCTGKKGKVWNENCPVLPFCSTLYWNVATCNPSHCTFNRNKSEAERHEDLPWAHGALIKEGLVNNSISNGPFVRHPRGLHTLGHRTITRFKVSKRHAFLYKTKIREILKGKWERSPIFESSNTNAFLREEKFRKENMGVESLKMVSTKLSLWAYTLGIFMYPQMARFGKKWVRVTPFLQLIYKFWVSLPFAAIWPNGITIWAWCHCYDHTVPP